MSLHSLNGAYPQLIPYRIRLSNGLTRTDPATFTAEEILDAGYIFVGDKPVVSNTQIVEWSTTLINWVVRDKTPEEIEQENEITRDRLSREITIYRDQLIAQGFWFNGIKYDSRPEDQKRISGAGLLAFMALTQGAQPGDFYWHGGSDPFVWIAQNNSIVPMDATTVINFGKAAASHESAYIFAARQLKDMTPIPENYQNSIYWPIDDGSTIL